MYVLNTVEGCQDYSYNSQPMVMRAPCEQQELEWNQSALAADYALPSKNEKTLRHSAYA